MDFHPIGLSLDLMDVKILQEAHPDTPDGVDSKGEREPPMARDSHWRYRQQLAHRTPHPLPQFQAG
ncbi:MAG: hypothetical protein MPW14_03950 [Candidatus Manganitrophus sp.]|nr:MAG: hypothetical protein MPW14_03950 [Candidatus Manganitrophus sp.]